MKKFLFGLLISLLTITLMGLTIKGQKGNPIYFQSEKDTRVGGPFESTNSNSRYALTEAIVEHGTFFFTDHLARFASPDIVEYQGKYFSIFTPGVPFIGVPFYLIGKLFGYPQIATYSVNIIFALLNFYLVSKLARNLGAGFYTSFASGLLFLFGTNALAYSLTFTQHHISTFILLLAVLNATAKRTFINNIFFGALLGIGLLVDIPNAIVMFPIALFVFFKNINIRKENQKIIASLKISAIGIIIGLIPLLSVFAWYNYSLTGSYTKIGQLLGRTDFPVKSEKLQLTRTQVEAQGRIENKEPQLIKTPYNPRELLTGFYILLFSNERGWFYYSPIISIGLIGLYLAYRNKETRVLTVLSGAVIGVIVLSYSMFGDPWGGWSFGPRYLITASAIASAGIGVAFAKFKKNLAFAILLSILAAYSILISTLGAMTTNAIAPKVEAVNLADPIPYTYEYNLQFVSNNASSSLFYNLYLSRILSVRDFILIYSSAIFLILIAAYVFSLKEKVNIEK